MTEIERDRNGMGDASRSGSPQGAEPDLGPEEPFGPVEALDPAVRVLWRLAGLGRATFLGAVAAALIPTFAAGYSLALGIAFVAVAAILALWLPSRRYRRLRFSVDDRYLYVRDGVIRHREKVIPISRMQHVDIQRGVFERMLGLASLTVFTAGGPAAAFRLPGLSSERGRALRDRILAAKENV